MCKRFSTQPDLSATVMQQSCISVIGAGSWGTALAIHLARCGCDVNLWGRNQAEQLAMQQNRHNAKYLQDRSPFPDSLRVHHNLTDALSGVDGVLIAVPSHAIIEIVEQLIEYRLPAHIAYATKGLVKPTEDASPQLIHEFFQQHQLEAVAVSGPTFAKEVAKSTPTALVVASQSDDCANWWQHLLHSNTMRAYKQTDITGVEVGGAIKNIIAIAVGICDGLGYGANTRAALITRGLAEITRLATILGAQPSTMMGLAGMGDLVLTATDNQSRNRRMGLLLAKGYSVADAETAIGQVVEGVEAVIMTHQMAETLEIEMPITEQIYGIIEGRLTLEQVVHNLLSRDATKEL